MEGVWVGRWSANPVEVVWAADMVVLAAAAASFVAVVVDTMAAVAVPSVERADKVAVEHHTGVAEHMVAAVGGMVEAVIAAGVADMVELGVLAAKLLVVKLRESEEPFGQLLLLASRILRSRYPCSLESLSPAI